MNEFQRRGISREKATRSAEAADQSLESILAALRAELPHLNEEYGVRSIGVFGSRVHGTHRPDSDLDLLVELGDKPIGLFAYVRMQAHLSQLLGVAVDLVDRKGLKPHIGNRILSEVRMA
jgi:predicted nucleotidyltransferase